MSEPTSPPDARASRADIEHVAALASLALTSEELDRLGLDLSSILGYVAELDALDTTGVAPLTHVSELVPVTPSDSGQPLQQETVSLRPDKPSPSLERPLVMGQAPATDGTFFKVPKVIER